MSIRDQILNTFLEIRNFKLDEKRFGMTSKEFDELQVDCLIKSIQQEIEKAIEESTHIVSVETGKVTITELLRDNLRCSGLLPEEKI